MVKWMLAREENNFVLEKLEDFNLASWYAVVVSVGFWAITYFSIRFTFDRKSPEWCIRIVALFHGLGTVIRGIPECVQESSGDWVFGGCEEESSKTQMLVLVISLGYFVFDLGWCLAYETETSLMILHHVYSCIALYRVLISEMSAGLAACGLGAMEMTNPFLQIRWFLRAEGYYHTLIFKIVEFIFIFSFFIIRIILGTYFFGIMLSNKNNSLEQKIFGSAIYVLSWVFYANIIRYFYLKYLQQNLPNTLELRQAT